MNTLLYINNQPLSLSKSVETLIDYYVIDIRNINERFDASSYLITIEATEEVRRVFRFPDNITTQDAIRLSKNYTAKLLSSNTLIAGKIKFANVKVQMNKILYEFHIVGGNGSWANDLIDKKLRSLDLWEYSHDWTQANQENAEIPNATKLYVYPLINNGQLGIFYVHNIELYTGNKPAFLVKGEIFSTDFTGKTLSLFGFNDSSYNNETTSFTVQNNYNGNGISRIIINDFDYVPFNDEPYGYIKIKGGNSRVRTTDRYPIIRVSDIINRIFRGIGYNLKSSFVDNILSKKYTAYEQFSGFAGQLRFQENFKFRAGIIEDKVVINQIVSTNEYKIAFDNTDYQINFDNTNSFDKSTNSYKPRVLINQSFYFALRFTVAQSMQLQFFVVIEDAAGSKSYQNGIALTTYTTGTHEVETLTFSYVNIPTSSKAYVIVRYFNSSGTITFLKGNCRFENRIRFTPKSEGDSIHLMQFLPDWSQLKYVSAIIKHFQLIVMTDVESRTVYIEDYDRFYDRNSIVDWSDKIDASQFYEIFEDIEDKGNSTIYKYKTDDADTELKYLKDIFNANYGSVEVANNSLFKTVEADEIEFDFSPTYMDTISKIGISEIKLPKIALNNFGDNEVRILHYDGLKQLSNDTWLQGGTIRTNIPYAFFYDDVNENYNSLHFDDNPNCVGLITKHFKPFLEEQQKSKMLRAYLNLSISDIAGFSSITDLKKDFRSVFLLKLRNEKGLFRLNKINQFDPNNISVTECEFVKLLPERFLPTYTIPVFEFSNIQTVFSAEDEQLTVRVNCKNVGGENGNATVFFTYRGTQLIASEFVGTGQSVTLDVVFTVLPIDFGGGLILPVNLFSGRLDWIYFGRDFVKSHWFIY